MKLGGNSKRREPRPKASKPVRDVSVAARRESGRSALRQRDGMLGTHAETSFGRIVALAADLLESPIAFISLVDGRRLWLQAEIALGETQGFHDVSILAAKASSNAVFVIPDAQADKRFADHPLVTRNSGLRFCAGARLETPEGVALGTICVVDVKPRPAGIGAPQEQALKALAEQVMTQLEILPAIERPHRVRDPAEMSLRESEAHYRSAVEYLPEMLWTADPAGNMLTISPRWEDWTGLSTDRALGQGFLSVVHPDDLGLAQESLQGSLASGAALDMRVRIRNADGSFRWVRAYGAPRRDADGTILRWYGRAVDIDEQVQTERRLTEAEERFRLAIAATRDRIWDWDLTTDRVVHGKAEVTTTGYVRADLPLTSRRWVDLIHPDDRPRVIDTARDAIRSGVDRWSIEYRYLKTDGSYAFLHDRASIVRNAGGNVVRIVGAASDITERRLIEQALRESEEVHRYTIELNRQIPWSADANGSLLEIGPRWLEVTGMARDAALGQGWRRALHPDDVAATLDFWARSLRSGDATDVRHRLKQRDGTYRWFRARAAARRDASGDILRWYGVVEDIHQQVEAEEVLRQLQTQLVHISRVSAMGTMASALAHELNQPLTAAANLLSASQDLLSRQADPDPSIVEFLAKAADQTLRVGDIIRRLRKLAANGRATLEEAEVRPVVEDAIFLARTSDLAGPSYIVVIPDSVPPVLADAVQVQQVLINLIRNASEAMTTSTVQQITIAAKACRDGVEVSVTDTGPGVPAAIRERLFTACDSGKADGLGIGLSISRTIVEAHGGRIWLADAPEGGSRFCFTLPIAGRG